MLKPMLFRAGVVVALLVPSLSEAALSCYDDDENGESFLLADSCDEIAALDALMVSCGAQSGAASCGDVGEDIFFVKSTPDGDGDGCIATDYMKKSFAAWDYGKQGSSKVLCDGYFAYMYFESPAICKAELPHLVAAVASHGDGEFPCELTTQTSTATSSATTSLSSTATTSLSSTATTSLSSTATTTPTTISTSPTSTATTTESSSATTSATSTITTDNVLGPLECVTYKEGAPSEQKWLLQPKSGYTCTVVARTLSGLLDRCDAVGLYEGDAVVGDVIACNQLPGFPYPNFMADMAVKKASTKTKCIFLPFLLQEMLKVHVGNGGTLSSNSAANVNAMFTTDNFKCDENNGNWLVTDKDKCDDMAELLGDAIKDFREGRFDSCAYSTQTTTATSSASSSATTSATTTPTTQSTSFSTTATTTASTTATTSQSTTAVTTVFRNVMSSCADGVAKGRLYSNPDQDCEDTVKILNEVLGECDENAAFGQNPNLKETFKCFDSGSHVSLIQVTNCNSVVNDLNAMVSEFRLNGRNNHLDGESDAVFSCQNPFGFVRTTCSTPDEVDLNTVIARWDGGRFRNCEYTTATSTASSTGTSTQSTSITSTASSSASTTASSTATTIVPGRLECGESNQGIITVFFIAGPSEHDSARQSGILETLLSECVDFLGQEKFTDTLAFHNSGSTERMYSKGTDGGSCSDTADRLNAMLGEYRRRGKYDGDAGTIGCDNGNRFYFASENDCKTDLGHINEMIERWGLYEFHECHLTTVTSTATSSLTTTAATSPTTTATSSVTSTGSTSITSTATSSISSTASSTATTTETSSATTSMTSSASTSVSSSQTSSATSSATTTVTSTPTTSYTSTGTSTVSSTVTSTGSSTVTSSVTTSQTTSGTTSGTSTATTSETSSITSTGSSTMSSTGTSTGSSTGTSTGSSTVSSTGSSTVTSSVTTSQTTSGTTSGSSTVTTSETTTASSTITSTRSQSGTSTVTTTGTSSATSSQTTTATSSITTTVSSTVTSSRTTSASSTATSSATTSGTSSATSSATTSQSSTATSSATSSATTSATSTVPSTATSSATSSITSSATSSATSSVSTTVTSSATTSATTSITSTASSSVTTSVTSSGTTTQSATETTSQTTSPTSSVTTSATTTESRTQVTTHTSTATSSITSTATSSGSTTDTTTPSSTVTTAFFAKLRCRTDDENFVGVDGEEQCNEHKDSLNNILEECRQWADEYVAEPIVCNKQGDDWLLGGATQPDCLNASKALNHAVREISKFPGLDFDFTCSLNSMHVRENDAGDCADFVVILNKVVDNRANDRFDWCSVTSPSSTVTSTVTTSQTSSATTTRSSTGITTVTSSVTSTQSSTVTSSATSSATSSETTSETTSGTTSATTSGTTTATSSVTSSQSSTVTSSATSTASASATSTGTSTASSTVSTSQTSSATTSHTSSATTSITSTVTSSGTTTETSTLTNSGTSTQTTSASSSATSTGTSTETTTASSSATSSATTTVTSSASSSQTFSATSSASTTESTTAITTESTTAVTTESTTAVTTESTTAVTTESTTAASTITTSVTTTMTSTASSTPTTLATTQTTTGTSTATTSASSSASATATTSPTSTATSTITTNNELTTVAMFFIGDASEVNGDAFDAGLRSAAVDVGVPEEEIHSTRIHAGSIVADMTVTGVEFGRTLEEAIASGELIVLVNGVAFVAYGNYSDVDPYTIAGSCTGHKVGNVSFPMSTIPLATQYPGFEERNLTYILPSEIYEFESELVDSFETTLEAEIGTQGMELCTVSHIYYGDAPYIHSAIFLSNTTANYAALVKDLDALQSAANSIAQGYISGEYDLEFRGLTLEASGMELQLVEDSVLHPEAAKSHTAGLIGAVVGVFVLSVLMLGFIYRAKLITEAEHKKRVSMAIAPGANIWRDANGISSAQDQVPFTAKQLSDFAFQFDMPNASPQSPYLETGGKRSSGNSLGSPAGKLGGQYRSAEAMSPAYRSPDYKALDAYKAAPDSLSAGYFSVGEINSPLSPPGLSSNHFYPSLGGSSVFMQNITNGFGDQKGPERSSANRASVASYSRGPGLGGVSGPKVSRPSLAVDDLLGDPDANAEFTSALRSLANYTDPSIAPLSATPAADDTTWGSEAWRGTLPGEDHDFPTLKAATMKKGRPSLEPGYATPNEAEIGMVEAVAVHYAAQRDSSGTPRNMVEHLVSAQPALSNMKRPSLLEEGETFGFDENDPDLQFDEDDPELEEAFVDKDDAFDKPRASFVQGMANIEKISTRQLLSGVNTTIMEEPEGLEEEE